MVKNAIYKADTIYPGVITPTSVNDGTNLRSGSIGYVPGGASAKDLVDQEANRGGIDNPENENGSGSENGGSGGGTNGGSGGEKPNEETPKKEPEKKKRNLLLYVAIAAALVALLHFSGALNPLYNQFKGGK